MAFVDPDSLQQAPAKPFVDPDTVRGTLGELGAGVARGAYAAVKATGSTIAGRDEMNGGEAGPVASYLKQVGQAGMEAHAAQPDQHGSVTNFVAGIPEAVGGAAPNIASAAAGGALGGLTAPLTGPVGAVAGAGSAGAAQAYAQAYDEALDEGKANKLEGDKLTQFAKDKATNSAAAMGAFAAIGPIGKGGQALAKAVGATGERTAAEVGKDLVTKNGLAEFGKKAAVGQAELSAIGAGQSVADNEVNKDAGLPSISRWDAVKGSLLPGLQAGVGFLPFHALAAHTDVRAALKIQDALQKPDNPFRVQAVKQVAEAMKKEDPDGAQMFTLNAAEAIKQGKPIGLDDSWTKGLHDSVFPETKEADPEDTFEGEGGGQPPPAGPMSAAVGEETQPGYDPTQNGQANAAGDEDSIAHEQQQAERERLLASGPFGQAAVMGMDSGAVDQKQADRQAELGTNTPAEQAEPDTSPSGQNIQAIARNEPVMTLGDAQKQAAAYTEGGKNEWAVVPHPNGGGYTIVPSHLIDPKVAEQYAGLQQGGPLKAATGSSMPFDIEAGAARAKQLTEQTGVEHELYPHPLARDKVGVRPKTEPVQESPVSTEREHSLGLNSGELAVPDHSLQAGHEPEQPVDHNAVAQQILDKHGITTVAPEGSSLLAIEENARGLKPEERNAFAALIHVAASAGHDMSPLHGVNVIVTEPRKNPEGKITNGLMTVFPMKRQLMLRADVLKTIEAGGADTVASFLSHEKWHLADYKRGTVDSASERHPAFAIDTDKDGGRTATGGIMKEVLDAYAAKDETKSSEFFNYPLSGWDRTDVKGEFGSHDAYTKSLQNEVFAQLGRFYETDPEAMQHELPQAFKLFEEIKDAAKVSNGNDALGRAVQSTLRTRPGLRSVPDHVSGRDGLRVQEGAGERGAGAGLGRSAVVDGRPERGLPIRDDSANLGGERDDAREGQRDEVKSKDLTGDGRGFTDFFKDATEGGRKPNTGKAYEPVLDIGHAKTFSKEYAKHRGNFDDHIATSIPGFREVQQAVGHAIVKAFPDGARVLDIGASEGSFIKAISAVSKGKIETVGVDPNPAMAKFFRSHSQVPGSKYDMSAFGAREDEGKPAWTEGDGTVIKTFKPKNQFDVVHEAMTFQFISDARGAQVARIKEMMKPNGVALFEQKFTPPKAEFDANEKKKDAYKAQYYSDAELARKKADVLERGQAAVDAEDKAKEEKVVGMHNLMVSPADFEKVLGENFKHVVQYWDSGNFKGFAASDDPKKLGEITGHFTTLKSEYATTDTPRQVKGVRVIAGDTPRVNIGLATNDGKGITVEEVRAALKKAGVKITDESVAQSSTERTFVGDLDRPLTPEEAHQVSVDLKQEAIVQKWNGKGELHGPNAAKWGAFDPKEWRDHRKYGPSEKGIEARERGDRKGELPKNPTVIDVAHFFNAKAAGRSYDNVNDVRAAHKALFSELKYQLQQARTGLGWYNGDVKKAWSYAAAVHPDLATDPIKRQLASLVTGIMSPGVKARINFRDGLINWGHYEKTGKFSEVHPDTGNAWGVSKAREQAIAHINEMLHDYDRWGGKENAERGVVEWMLTEHTRQLLDAEKARYGVYAREEKPGVEGYKSKADILGGATELHLGTAMFGPKVGPFVANLNGLNTGVTVDVWATRTLRRMFGKLPTTTRPDGKIDGEQPTNQERALFTMMANAAARDPELKSLGIADGPDAQGVIWFFEQQLYDKLIGGTESGFFSDGARDYAEAKGVSVDKPGAGDAALAPIETHTRPSETDANAILREHTGQAEDEGVAQPDVWERGREVRDDSFDPADYVKASGRKASERELAPKETTGKAAEAEQQFTKSGEPVTAAPDKNKPEWIDKKDDVTQSFLRKAGVYIPKQTWRDRWAGVKKNMGAKIIQGVFDQYRPVLDRVSKYSYQLLRMASASDNGLAAMVERGHVELNKWGAIQIKQGTKSLKQIMAPLMGEHDRFLAWMAANRAEMLMGEGREHNFTPEEIKAGKLLNMANADDPWKGEGTRAAAYKQAKEDFAAMNKSVLDIAEAAGVIDPEARKLFEHDYYVNFRREEDGEPEFNPSNLSGMVNVKGVKRLQGGENALHDLMANTMSNWSSLMSSAMKNNAAWHTLEEAEGLGIAHRIKASEAGKGTVYVLEHGKESHWIVDDPMVSQAIGSLAAVQMRGPVMKAMGAMKHALTVGTTWSPIFRMRHTIREQITAMAANPTSYNFAKNWVDGLKYSSHDNPEWGNAKAGGANFNLGLDFEGDRAAYVKRLIKENIDPKSLVDSPNKAKALFGALADHWKEVGERSDSITRANLYRQNFAEMVAQGMDPERAHFEASYIARDAMDYSLHGTLPALRMITQVVPFMNARLQGIYKLGRGAHENPKRFAGVVGGITLATVALSLSQYGDKDIEAASDWDKDNNWLVKVGKTMYRIPKPFEVGALATVVDRAVDVAMKGFQPTDMERFRWRALAAVGSQLNMNPVPQMVFPALELWANKNTFTGMPIESDRDMKLSPTMRVGANTSATAQLVSKGLNAVLPDAGTMSPEQIDFAVSAWFGWVGAHAVATADLALRPAAGLTERPTRRIDDYFAIGDFAHELPSNQSQFVSDFYDHLKKVQTAVGDLHALQHAGKNLEAVQQLKDKGDLIALDKVYSAASLEIGKLNQQARWVQMTNKTPDEKRAALDHIAQMKNMYAQRAEAARDQRLNK